MQTSVQAVLEDQDFLESNMSTLEHEIRAAQSVMDDLKKSQTLERVTSMDALLRSIQAKNIGLEDHLKETQRRVLVFTKREARHDDRSTSS